jgi:NADP-dependent 3-hydroxy acid dehydrogenase YdfG
MNSADQFAKNLKIAIYIGLRAAFVSMFEDLRSRDIKVSTISCGATRNNNAREQADYGEQFALQSHELVSPAEVARAVKFVALQQSNGCNINDLMIEPQQCPTKLFREIAVASRRKPLQL